MVIVIVIRAAIKGGVPFQGSTLLWGALAALTSVPVLLLVTGSRLCRVTTRVSSGLLRLIVITVLLLVLKAAVFSSLGLANTNKRDAGGGLFRGLDQAIGLAQIWLVAAPSVVFAALLGFAAVLPARANRSAEAEDYDDAALADLASPPQAPDGTVLSARRRWVLAAGAVAGGLGIPAWKVLAHGWIPGIWIGFQFVPYLVLAVAAFRPWIRRKGWYMLAVTLFLIVAYQSLLARLLFGRSGLISVPNYLLETLSFTPWLLAGLAVLVAWIVCPVRPNGRPAGDKVRPEDRSP